MNTETQAYVDHLAGCHKVNHCYGYSRVILRAVSTPKHY